MNVTRENLNDVMQFEHVIQVHEDGSVTEPAGVYAPEVWSSQGDLDGGTGWSLMSGYTGQYGYRGPVMHPSEYIGGRLADDILTAPGYYVAVVVPDEDNPGGEPAGWAAAYRPAGAGDGGPR